MREFEPRNCIVRISEGYPRGILQSEEGGQNMNSE